MAANVGGEVHTFTEVEEFGGGIVPRLNELAGVSVLHPPVDANDRARCDEVKVARRG